jgi:hypothetical protein
MFPHTFSLTYFQLNLYRPYSTNYTRVQELKFLGQRNQFTPLLKASDPPDASPRRFRVWSLALAKVATEPDVLFHALCNKPKLVRSKEDAAVSKKLTCDD